MPTESEKNLKIFDKGVLVSVAIISAIILLLGLMGVKEIFGWKIDYSYVTVALLGAIATHLALAIYGSFGQREIEDRIDMSAIRIENKIDEVAIKVIDSLRGVERRTFTSIKHVDKYVAERIKTAKLCVSDLNWQDFRPAPYPRDDDRDEIDDDIDESIKYFCNIKRPNDTKCVYNEIFTFPDTNRSNLGKMKRHLKYGNIYTCSYYETKDTWKFPKMQFVIIDHEEVIFVSSEYSGNFCAIKDPKIVNICENYFDQAHALSTRIKRKNQPAIENVVKAIEAIYQN